MILKGREFHHCLLERKWVLFLNQVFSQPWESSMVVLYSYRIVLEQFECTSIDEQIYHLINVQIVIPSKILSLQVISFQTLILNNCTFYLSPQEF